MTLLALKASRPTLTRKNRKCSPLTVTCFLSTISGCFLKNAKVEDEFKFRGKARMGKLRLHALTRIASRGNRKNQGKKRKFIVTRHYLSGYTRGKHNRVAIFETSKHSVKQSFAQSFIIFIGTRLQSIRKLQPRTPKKTRRSQLAGGQKMPRWTNTMARVK